jgi:hypothetical protein
MAMKPMTRRALAGVLATILLGLGCNPLLAPFQLFDMGDNHYPSEFEFYEKAKKAKQKDEITIAVLSYGGAGLAPEFSGSDQDLTKMFIAQAKAAFATNKEKVKIVPLADVDKFKRTHDWTRMEGSEIARKLKVDYIVDMELASLSLYERKSMNQLYRGRVRINIKIVDADKNADEVFPPKSFEYQYPKGEQSIAADDMSVDMFRQKSFQKFCTALTALFTGLPPDHDF